jgi:hypothetical protein
MTNARIVVLHETVRTACPLEPTAVDSHQMMRKQQQYSILARIGFA